MAGKCINYIKARPKQTPWSRDPETLFRFKIKETKRFMIFESKKRGDHFLTPPTPPHLPEKLKKVSFNRRGSGGGPDKKVIEVCVYWTKK